MSYPGLCQGLLATANPIDVARAYGLQVFEIRARGERWCVTTADGRCGGSFFDRAAAFKFAREEAELCDGALVCGCDTAGRAVDLLVVEHPVP